MDGPPEEALNRYQVGAPLDEPFLRELRRALLEPHSPELRSILEMVGKTGCYELGRLDGGRELVKHGAEAQGHLFYSEAIERAAVASSLSSRLRNGPLDDPVFFAVWQICEHCSKRYRDFEPGFAPADMDRLLRARTLASEEIGASNTFIHLWRYLEPAFIIPDDVGDDPARAALYARLIERLERSEAETRRNQERRDAVHALTSDQRNAAMAEERRAARFFKEQDYAMLAALRRALGATDASSAAAARESDEAARESRRSVLLASLSPVWRDLFEWLLDLHYDSDTLPLTLQSHPRVAALAAAGDEEAGTVLTDLVRLRRELPDHAGDPMARLDALARHQGGWRSADLVPFVAWKKLSAVGAILARHIVALDDAKMADALKAAQSWRPLCDFGLLDSAERTLQRGSTPLTIAALANLARKPSHGIVPGDAGPDYEGDRWWNGAPPRALALVRRYGREAQSGSGRGFGRLFGRRQPPL